MHIQRLSATILCLLALLAFTGCDSGTSSSSDSTTNTSTATTTTSTDNKTQVNNQGKENSENTKDELPVSNLRGQVKVDGSSTVFPIARAAISDFNKYFPDVSVELGVSGTGGGFSKFLRGETNISNASRPIKPGEFQKAAEQGIVFYEIPIALDGLTVVVNKENNWVDQLSIEDLQRIFLEHEGQPAPKWSDIREGWPDEVISINMPDDKSGTFDYFKEVVLPEGRSFRSDVSPSADDNLLVTGIKGDKNAIGFFGAAYYYNNKDIVKAVPIVNPATGKAVYPSPENVIDGTYAPLSRPLFFYVNAKDYAMNPAVGEFVDYYLDHADEFAEKVQYVALPAELKLRAKKMLAEQKFGTCYLDENMHKREGSVMEIYVEKNLHSTK